MLRCFSTLLVVVCLSLPLAHAQVVGSAVGSGVSQNLIGFEFGPLPPGLEPYVANPFSLEFTASTDVFGVESRATAPANFLDDSASGGGDTFGVIKAADNDPFFGVVDTVNDDNPDNIPLTATWTFDTSLNASGLYLAMDFAAMGDFEGGESGDIFTVDAAFDGGQFQTVFANSVDDAFPAVDYILEDGAVRSLADPLFFNGVQLDNNFTTISAPLSGAGSSLTIRFSAITNGGDEVVLFRNLEIHASDPGVGGGQSGDFTGDGLVDAADYTVWRDNFGQTEGDLLGGNGDGGTVGASDYDLWAASYGEGAPIAPATSAPEPASLALLLVAGLAATRRRA